jgi:hypothetical protein
MLGLQACDTGATTGTASGDSSAVILADTATAGATTFEDFLGIFPIAKDFQDWPQTAQWPIVKSPEFFSQKPIEPLLLKTFRAIPPSQYQHIPTHKIVRLDSNSTTVGEPYSAFKFYAFRRIEREKYWLLGIYAQKQNGMANSEYNAHPFLMVTYSKQGEFIDDHVWWFIEDDMLQVWTEIAVAGDTLLVGRKEEIADKQLSEIYSKTIVEPSGKFRQVYANFPAPSTF